jgi:hypothetical protein
MREYSAVAVALILIGVALSGCSTASRKERISSGDVVRLDSGDGGSVTVARDRNSLEVLITAAINKDEPAYAELALGNKILSVENGTKVQVIEDGVASEVLLLSERFKGERVWVDRTWLKKEY